MLSMLVQIEYQINANLESFARICLNIVTDVLSVLIVAFWYQTTAIVPTDTLQLEQLRCLKSGIEYAFGLS